MSKVLILPDIHGRSFWKDSIDKFLSDYPMSEEENKDNKIVFLGDYVDPYEWIDHISYETAFNNMMNLTETAVDLNTKYGDFVTLLLGNHDLHYIYNTGEDCRLDYNRYHLYHKLFNTLIETGRIRIAYSVKTHPDSNYNWLFSHAGIQLDWLLHAMTAHKIEVPDYSAEVVASLLNSHITDIMKQLAEVSAYRGGCDKYGSCLWADLNEMKGNNVLSLKSQAEDHGLIKQVFAHTYSNEPYIDKKTGIYMIDTGFTSYLLDENDILNEYVKEDRSFSF